MHLMNKEKATSYLTVFGMHSMALEANWESFFGFMGYLLWVSFTMHFVTISFKQRSRKEGILTLQFKKMKRRGKSVLKLYYL